MTYAELLAVLDEIDVTTKFIRNLLKPQAPPTPDLIPPTDPTLLAVSLVSNQPSLTCVGSTDNIQVAGYEFQRKFGVGGTYALLQTSPVPALVDSTATASATAWYYRVRAFDTASPPNYSGFSNEVNQVISSPTDVTAPNIPGQPAVAVVDNTTNPPTFTTTVGTVTDINPGDGSPVTGVQDYPVLLDGVQVDTLLHPTGPVGSAVLLALGNGVTGTDTGTVFTANALSGENASASVDCRLYNYQAITGGFVAVVRVTGFSGTGSVYQKFGISVREDLSAGSRFVDFLTFGVAIGLKGEQRTQPLQNPGGGSIAPISGSYWLRVVADGKYNISRSYSTLTSPSPTTDSDWTAYDTLVSFFAASQIFIGLYADPNVGAAGSGSIAATYSGYAVTAQNPMAYKGTGVAGATKALSFKARDKVPNTSVAGTSRSITFSAPSTTKPALWMANSWIGGDQINSYNNIAFQTYVSKCRVVLLQWRAGWDSTGISPHSISSIFGSIKALATAQGRTPPKMGLYFGTTFIDLNATDAKILTAFNNNFWWLYTTYHSGSIVLNDVGLRCSNITSGSQVDGVTGKNAQQWIVAYNNDWMINGGALGYATGPNVANPNLDYINWDDQYIQVPKPGDWNRTGSGYNAATAATANRTAYAAVVNAFRAANGKLFAGNTGQVGSNLGSPYPEFVGLYDMGFMDQMIGSFNTYEYNSSIANFILDYQRQSTAVVAGGDMTFGHINVSPTDGSDGLTFDASGNVATRSPAWQGMRHAIGAMGCIGDAGYQPTFTFTNTAQQTPIWPDCMAVNVANRHAYTYPGVDAGIGWTGPWVDPPQTAAWSNGVWRRRAQFATVYWNQRGNGPRTVTLEGFQARYLGVQNPSIDHGNQITTLSLGDRDGAILCNQ